MELVSCEKMRNLGNFIYIIVLTRSSEIISNISRYTGNINVKLSGSCSVGVKVK